MAESDPGMLVWWGSKIECISALSRIERAGALYGLGPRWPSTGWPSSRNSWHEIEPSEEVRESAAQLSSRSPAADGGRPPAWRSLRRRRKPSFVAAGADAGPAPGRCGAQGRLRNGRHSRGLTARRGREGRARRRADADPIPSAQRPFLKTGGRVSVYHDLRHRRFRRCTRLQWPSTTPSGSSRAFSSQTPVMASFSPCSLPVKGQLFPCSFFHSFDQQYGSSLSPTGINMS